MKNVQLEHKNGLIVLTIDPTKEIGQSRSGKTIIVATTGGNQKIDTSEGQVMLGVNVFKYPA